MNHKDAYDRVKRRMKDDLVGGATVKALKWRLRPIRYGGVAWWASWLAVFHYNHVRGRICLRDRKGEPIHYKTKREAKEAGRRFAEAHGLALKEKEGE